MIYNASEPLPHEGSTEPFSSSDLAGLKDVDGFGELGEQLSEFAGDGDTGWAELRLLFDQWRATLTP